MLGMVHLDEGDATVLGRPVGDPAARRALGYLPEKFQYPDWLDGRHRGHLTEQGGLEVPLDAGAGIT